MHQNLKKIPPFNSALKMESINLKKKFVSNFLFLPDKMAPDPQPIISQINFKKIVSAVITQQTTALQE